MLQKTKVVLADLANPKRVSGAWPDNAPADHKELIGTIIGIASAVKTATAMGKDGLTPQTFEGLSGTFEAIPADAKKETISSGVCYLPEAFQGPLIKALEAAEEKGESLNIRLAAEVYVAKATNPQGYTWMLRPIAQPEAHDPLASVRALLPKPAENDVSQPEMEPAKEKAKAKA